VSVADRPPAVALKGVHASRCDAEPSQREPQPHTRRLRRRLFHGPQQGQQLRRTVDQVAQGCRFRLVGDIVEQSRIAGANLLDIDPDRCQGHRGHPDSVGVTDRDGEARLLGKVRPAAWPMGNRRVGWQPVSIATEVRICLAKSEPSTQVVGKPIVEDARHHLCTDAANGHALG
jgi:hypothetical protein